MLSSSLVWIPGAAEWAPLESVDIILRKTRAGAGLSATSGVAGKRPRDEGDLGGAEAAPGDIAEAASKKKTKKKRAKEASWVKVTGLPQIGGSCASLKDELTVHFRRAGILKADAVTGEPMIFFEDVDSPEAFCALICFLAPASVDLSISLLDGAPLRPGTSNGGWPLVVEPSREPKNLVARAPRASKDELTTGTSVGAGGAAVANEGDAAATAAGRAGSVSGDTAGTEVCARRDP